MPLHFDTANMLQPAQQVIKLREWNIYCNLGFSELDLRCALSQAPKPLSPITSLLPVLVPYQATPEETFEKLWKIMEHEFPLYKKHTGFGWEYKNAARRDASLPHTPHLRETSTHIAGLRWETLEFVELTDFGVDVVLPSNAAHASAFMTVLYEIFSRDVGVVLGGYELDSWFAPSLNGMYTPIVRDRHLHSMHVTRRLLNTYVPLIEKSRAVV